MAPRGLELVHVLQPPAQAQVPDEEVQYDLLLYVRPWGEETQEGQTQQEERERRLVACAVIHADEGAKRREPVRLDEGNRRAELSWEQCAQERRRFLCQTKRKDREHERLPK